MSGFKLPGLQVHFWKSKASGETTTTLDEILLKNKKLLGDMRSNTCSDMCPTTHPKSFQQKRDGIPSDWEKPIDMKIMQHSHK